MSNDQLSEQELKELLGEDFFETELTDEIDAKGHTVIDSLEGVEVEPATDEAFGEAPQPEGELKEVGVDVQANPETGEVEAEGQPQPGEGEAPKPEPEPKPATPEDEAEQAIKDLAELGTDVEVEKPQSQEGEGGNNDDKDCPNPGKGAPENDTPKKESDQPKEEKPKKGGDKECFVVVRCTPEEKRKLDALSVANGMVRSDLIKAQWHGLDGWDGA